MDHLTGQVVVITGGASGMGRAFATRFAQAGMKVVLADVEEPALDQAVVELQSAGAEALGVVCNVADHSAMVELGTRVEEVFGPPQVLCLNAGIGVGGPLAEASMADWKWVIDVNLWGVIHGLDVFLSGLISRNKGHVIFTASVAGHYSFPHLGPYAATKYGVVAIAETLHTELRAEGSEVGVTCLSPGLVSTNIFSSERNRPEALTDPNTEPRSEEDLVTREVFLEWVQANGLQPAEVAEMIHRAVLDGTFWVFTDDEHLSAISERHTAIRDQKEPPPYAPLINI